MLNTYQDADRRRRSRTRRVADLERTLDKTITALVEHRRKHRSRSRLKVITSAELASKEWPDRDPIGSALKEEVRDVALELAPLLGWDELHALVERVASRDPANYGRRQTPLYSVFDGMRLRDGSLCLA